MGEWPSRIVKCGWRKHRKNACFRAPCDLLELDNKGRSRTHAYSWTVDLPLFSRSAYHRVVQELHIFPILPPSTLNYPAGPFLQYAVTFRLPTVSEEAACFIEELSPTRKDGEELDSWLAVIYLPTPSRFINQSACHFRGMKWQALWWSEVNEILLRKVCINCELLLYSVEKRRGVC